MNLHEQEYINRGRFNLGVNAVRFRGLPSYERLLAARKKLVRRIRVDAFFTVFLMTGMMKPDLLDRIAAQPVKTILAVLATSAIYTLFFSLVIFFSTAFEVVKAEREVRRLIYEELLRELEKSEVNTPA